jgi:DNA-binding NtrC family response regulator
MVQALKQDLAISSAWRHSSQCLTIAGTGGGIMAKKILVVEDVEDSRAILIIILQRFCGYETIEAGTGTEAIQKTVVERPDLIVMDLGLPDITGVEVAKALKENPNTAQIPSLPTPHGHRTHGRMRRSMRGWCTTYKSRSLRK